MLFNSMTFAIFFGIVLLLHRSPIRWTTRKANLLVASYLFYAAWSPPFVALIWFSTIVDWYAAKWMYLARGLKKRRLLLLLSLSANLGVLGFFKYGDFLLEGFVSWVGLLGIQYQPPGLDIILPVGISFYTFQTLSYTIDVYRGRLEPSDSFLDFALFVTFFPQLVAGPIVRAAEFLPQLKASKQATETQLGWGLSLLTIGLFQKVVLADRILGPVADTVFGAADKADFIDAWIGTLAFSGQIFFDFSGYSLCAIGAGLSLGFALPDNFRFPYAAIGFSDFWRRWHISLSSWLRDYLYIPLGGNRKGKRRTQINLMLTMLLGGLWHGAAWRFVGWGGLHGVYLMGERALHRSWGGRALWKHPVGQVALVLLTYGLVCLTWVFFRAADFPTAFTLLSAMTVGAPNLLGVGVFEAIAVAVVTAGLLTTHWFLRDSTLEDLWGKVPWWMRSGLLASLLIAIALAGGDSRAFIYFQF